MKCIRPYLYTPAEWIDATTDRDATVALCACFRERSGSNLGQVIVLDWGFSLLSSVFWVPLYKYWTSTFIVRDQFLRDLFQHMNHAVIRRRVAWITDIVFRYPTQTILFLTRFVGRPRYTSARNNAYICSFVCHRVPLCTAGVKRRTLNGLWETVVEFSAILC